MSSGTYRWHPARRASPPCLRMADRDLLAGYPRYEWNWEWVKSLQYHVMARFAPIVPVMSSPLASLQPWPLHCWLSGGHQLVAAQGGTSLGGPRLTYLVKTSFYDLKIHNMMTSCHGNGFCLAGLLLFPWIPSQRISNSEFWYFLCC